VSREGKPVTMLYPEAHLYGAGINDDRSRHRSGLTRDLYVSLAIRSKARTGW